MYMNQQTYTDRNEFIEEFRKQQGLPNNEKKSQKKGSSKSSNTVITQGNQKDGRWEYLYQLEKLKRIKLTEQRKMKEQGLYEKDLTECTFTPKLNTNKSTKYLHSGQSVGALSNVSSNLPSMTNYNSNSNLHQDGSVQYGTLLERQAMWSHKRHIKLENIKQTQLSKDNQECNFRPKIVH
jgi:hypothetical protein